MLLTNTDILLYTPENEHFGIVPVEAMHLGCIVIACDSGGPLESIKHGETGFLRKPDSAIWAQQILSIDIAARRAKNNQASAGKST